MNNLMPISLAKMGVKRLVSEPDAELLTIQKTPYPVLSSYKKVCAEIGVSPFAGGTYSNQGPKGEVGYLTSGFRDSSDTSPHGFALALDVAVGDMYEQYRWGIVALKQGFYKRFGIYPQNGIVHLDAFDEAMRLYYNKAKFWVRIDGEYFNFDTPDLALNFAEKKE